MGGPRLTGFGRGDSNPQHMRAIQAKPANTIISNICEPTDIPETFAGKKTEIAVKVGKSFFLLFKIAFSQSDGSLFIIFPRFSADSGIVSLCTSHSMKPGHVPNHPLASGGKVTKHLVKYSHHPDGRAHFSQQGKVFTEVQKQSIALDKYSGHAFTIQLQGLSGFESWEDDGSRPNRGRKKSWVAWDLGSQEPPAVKFTGHLFTKRCMRGRQMAGKNGAVIGTVDDQGRAHLHAVFSPPTDNPLSFMRCLIGCQFRNAMNTSGAPCLTFIGGFDPKSISTNITRSAQFLAMAYPCSNTEALQNQIGTIDIRPWDEAFK